MDSATHVGGGQLLLHPQCVQRFPGGSVHGMGEVDAAHLGADERAVVLRAETPRWGQPIDPAYSRVCSTGMNFRANTIRSAVDRRGWNA